MRRSSVPSWQVPAVVDLDCVWLTGNAAGEWMQARAHLVGRELQAKFPRVGEEHGIVYIHRSEIARRLTPWVERRRTRSVA